MPFHVLASDFHLTPERPEELEMFGEFTRTACRGARTLFLLGDLFEFWTGPKMLRIPGYDPVFTALRGLSAAGTEVVLFHGNRDFLLGRQESRRAGGRVVGEELAVDLCGRRYLLLHGDSLCTADVGYQRTKPLLRAPPVRWLSHVVPLSVQLHAASGLRGKSMRSVAHKPRDEMEIVGDEVRRRFAEGYDALICGHVHAPGVRDYGTPDHPVPVYVLGDWHGGGVYAIVDEQGPRLERFDAAS